MEAYPLHWPDGWRRTTSRQDSRFKTGFGVARIALSNEIARMGGQRVVISSNIPLRLDGMPRASSPEPADSGVAVYFRYKDKDMVFACDKFRYTRDNIYSIAKTIEALRGIERWGASDMMERAFTGFKALPSGGGREWWDVLQVNRACSREAVEANFRRLARDRHPDAGGSSEAMAELNEARRQALMEIGS